MAAYSLAVPKAGARGQVAPAHGLTSAALRGSFLLEAEGQSPLLTRLWGPDGCTPWLTALPRRRSPWLLPLQLLLPPLTFLASLF